ncbi:MAG: cation diffusion facilitator family transporter, partial [Candidatus Aureabacteria bacterium]|nr:cation diffusion facilitator family transporter [Candidatus Auribacterota bacterium]
GLIANSLSLLADAGHNLSDVMGLLVAWGAIRLSRWQPTEKHTYGLRKSSVLAALFNALFLLVSVGGISWEAIRRFKEPATVQAGTVIWVAAAGIVINAATALMFRRGRKEDLNVRGAFLHMSADAAISAGVVAAGILISLTGIAWIDPVVSLLIAGLILIGTWGLLKESVNLALDAAPENIDPRAVQDYLTGLPEVKDVHHLHIWGLSTRDAALTAHMVLSRPELNNELLARIRKELHDRYRIGHATIQFELCEKEICLSKRCSL